MIMTMTMRMKDGDKQTEQSRAERFISNEFVIMGESANLSVTCSCIHRIRP